MIKINLLKSRPRTRSRYYRVPDSEFDRIREEQRPHPTFGYTDTQCESCMALRDELHITEMRNVELEEGARVNRENLRIQQEINRTLYGRLQRIKHLVNQPTERM